MYISLGLITAKEADKIISGAWDSDDYPAKSLAPDLLAAVYGLVQDALNRTRIPFNRLKDVTGFSIAVDASGSDLAVSVTPIYHQ